MDLTVGMSPQVRMEKQKMFLGLEPNVVDRIQRVYLQESIPKYMNLVQRSIGSGNLTELRRGLYSLRYNFKIFGEESAIELLDTIRESAISGDWGQVKQLFPTIEQMADTLRKNWEANQPKSQELWG
ncbi:hypothetical protein HOF92_10825 [bacterium]|nr:hypothetical protein [bacterium]